jgi:collagenase-like PrtC family protease
MRLSLAPISGRYAAEAIVDFYREAAASPDIERVYVGELFCSKRLIPMRAFEESVALLEAAGKEVVFSTLALPVGEADYEAAAPYVERVTTVEINNLGFISWLKERFAERTILAGPIVSLYNRDDLEIVRDWGCSGVSLHIDLMPESVLDLCANGAIPAEVFLHGRPPLAFSWRCYAARFAERPQNACGHVCREQDGLVLDNLEGEAGFIVDGLAVYPGQVVATVEQARDYAQAKAAFGRLWVGPGSVANASAAYGALLRGERSVEQTKDALEATADGPVRYGPVARRRLS